MISRHLVIKVLLLRGSGGAIHGRAHDATHSSGDHAFHTTHSCGYREHSKHWEIKRRINEVKDNLIILAIGILFTVEVMLKSVAKTIMTNNQGTKSAFTR